MASNPSNPGRPSDPSKPPEIGGDDTPWGKCAVGLRNVTINVTECTNGSPMLLWTLFLGWTNVASAFMYSSNGASYFTVFCVMPGVKYRLVANGYKDLDFEITAADVSSRTKAVCMTALPPPPPRPRGRCCFTTAALAQGGYPDSGIEASLDSLRLFRSAIEGAGAGGEFVRQYDDPDIAEWLTKAVESDQGLALLVTVSLLELQPLLSNLSTQYWWASLKTVDSKAPLGKLALLQPGTVRRLVSLCKQFNEKTGGTIEKPLMQLASQVENCTNLNVFEIIDRLQGHDNR